MTKNELYSMLRRTKNASDEAKAAAANAQAKLEAIQSSVTSLQRAFQGGAMKPLTNRERALANCLDMRPTWLVMSKEFPNGIDAIDEMERQTDTVGRLIVDRIRASWRRSSTGLQGYISSAQAGDIDHTSTNVVDFMWQLVDGRNNQYLQNEPIPSDLLARNDGDGFPAGGLVFEPGTDVRIIITPLRSWPADGYLTFVFEGIQCYDQRGAPE